MQPERRSGGSGRTNALAPTGRTSPIRADAISPLGPLSSSLGECVRLIQERERAGAVLSHQLGTVYAHVLHEELYTQEGFKDFWEWVEKGMGRSRKYVRKLLVMVDRFPDSKEVSIIGATNARIIASVNDESARARLVRAAKKGVPTKIIEARIQNLRQRLRESRSERKPGPPPKYIEIDTLIRTRRNLEVGKPVRLVDGVNVELRAVGGGRFGLRFNRSR